MAADGRRQVLKSGFTLKGNRLCLHPWTVRPEIEPGGYIEIIFQAGYGSPNTIPDDLVLAVKMLVAQGYHLRNGGAESAEDALPTEIDDLLSPYKGVRL
jgi:uncharacterized phiE125 gp8 family phage protein